MDVISDGCYQLQKNLALMDVIRKVKNITSIPSNIHPISTLNLLGTLSY